MLLFKLNKNVVEYYHLQKKCSFDKGSLLFKVASYFFMTNFIQRTYLFIMFKSTFENNSAIGMQVNTYYLNIKQIICDGVDGWM